MERLKPILIWSLGDFLVAVILLGISIYTDNILGITSSAVFGLSGLGKLIFSAFQ